MTTLAKSCAWCEWGTSDGLQMVWDMLPHGKITSCRRCRDFRHGRDIDEFAKAIANFLRHQRGSHRRPGPQKGSPGNPIIVRGL